MTRIFDTMAGILNRVFGDSVTVTPPGGVARDIQAVFRAADAVVLNESGVETITPFPTLAVHRGEITDLVPGGVADPGNGHTYRCLATMDGGSPAADGFVLIQLERL